MLTTVLTHRVRQCSSSLNTFPVMNSDTAWFVGPLDNQTSSEFMSIGSDYQTRVPFNWLNCPGDLGPIIFGVDTRISYLPKRTKLWEKIPKVLKPTF